MRNYTMIRELAFRIIDSQIARIGCLDVWKFGSEDEIDEVDPGF